MLFELENKIFTRNYHRKAPNPEELLNRIDKGETFVVYNQKVPIGFIAFEEKDNGIEIYSLGVLPEYQGKGFGGLLLKKILNLAKSNRLFLLTNPQNSQAICFYLKYGFQICGWKDDYYHNGQPRLLLEKGGSGD